MTYKESTDAVMEVQEVAQNVLQKTITVEKTYEERVNEFLDIILEIQRDLSDLTHDMGQATTSLQTTFNGLTAGEHYVGFKVTKEVFGFILTVGKRLYASYRKSKGYTAYKSQLHSFKAELDRLQETIEWLDRKFNHYPNDSDLLIFADKIKAIKNARK
jgi:hypothetical protein